MNLPEGCEYGDVRGGLGRWCIHLAGMAVMLCDAEIYHIPASESQPDPAEEGFQVHDVCVQRLVWLLVSGICRGCGRRTAVVDAVIEAHGCRGDGRPPKGGTWFGENQHLGGWQ